MPTIVDGDGTTIWEANAIVRYIAARYGAGSLWPEDASARARADLWLDWMQTTLLPNLAPVFLGLIRTSVEERDMAKIERCARAMGESWRILDAHMEGRRFVAAGDLTMGDIAVGAACYRYHVLEHRAPGAPQHFGLVRATAGAPALPHPRDDSAELGEEKDARPRAAGRTAGAAGCIRRRHTNGRQQPR